MAARRPARITDSSGTPGGRSWLIFPAGKGAKRSRNHDPNFSYGPSCGRRSDARSDLDDDPRRPEPRGRVVPLTPRAIGRRLTAAAEDAGIERRVTAHSGRLGLASKLSHRGASTTAVRLADHWRTARMVAHDSAGATAAHGAVAHYL